MSAGGVFRRPHDYRPALGVVAVLFPVGAPDVPPLQQPSAQQAAVACIREAWIPRPLPLFSAAVFPPVVDNPSYSIDSQRLARMAYREVFVQTPQQQLFPSAVFPPPSVTPVLPGYSPQQNASAAYRTPDIPQQRIFPDAGMLDYDPGDAAIGLGAVQEAAWAAYRAPYSWPAQLALTIPPPAPPDAPPLAQPSILAQIAYRDSYFRPPQMSPILAWDSLGDPVPLAQTAQNLAQLAYRPVWSFPGQRPPPVPWDLLGDPVAPLPFSQGLAQAAYRPEGRPGKQQQNIGTPWDLLGDPVPLPSPVGQLAQGAYRLPWIQPTPRAALAWDSLGDAVPLVSFAQALAQAAYKGEGRPQILPALFSAAVFPPTVTAPPLLSIAGLLAQLAYKPEGSPQRLPLLFSPAIFPPIVQAPPLMPPLGAQQIAQAALRETYFPRPGAPVLPFDLFVVDPLLRRLGEQIAARLYDPNPYPFQLAARQMLRASPFAALFPPPIVPPGDPTVTLGVLAASQTAQIAQLKTDIVKMSRRLEYLISLMEKKGLKT